MFLGHAMPRPAQQNQNENAETGCHSGVTVTNGDSK